MAADQSGLKALFTRIAEIPPFRIINTSLRARLVLFFALITVVTVSIVGFVSYGQVLRSIEESTTASTQVIAEQLRTNIELVFRDAERFLKIGTHETTLDFLSPHERTEEQTYRQSLEIISLFRLFREIYEFDSRIKGIHILGFNGNNIGEQEGRYSLEMYPTELKTVQAALVRAGDVRLVPNRTIDFAGFESYGDVISIARAIVRPVTREILGVIIVDVDRKAITALCEGIVIGETGFFSIISDSGAMIHPPELELASVPLSEKNRLQISSNDSGYLVDRQAGEDELYVFSTLEPWGWKIVGRVRMDELMENAWRIRNITLLAIILSLLFSTALYFLVSNAVTHPIRDLMTVMQDAESGDLDVRAVIDRNDEITDLSRGFNRMLEEIQELMQRVIREQEDLKKSELKALQAQINPHFLYNTLDAIVWMAEADSTEDVVSVTKALSKLFRISLSKGREWISGRDEVDHVRCYLEIQKMRHADLLEYEIHECDGLEDVQVLKLILQPIVENAVDHGIKHRRRGGKVTVSCRLDADRLRFKVVDDGVGIPEQKLAEIR